MKEVWEKMRIQNSKKSISSLRKLVSWEKRRFIQDGFDLDLSYITTNIIAMGFPSEGIEAVYWNPLKEVQRFLNKYHDKNYWVYNLCSEKQYDNECFYDVCSKFQWEDHHPPPFWLLVDLCKDIQSFLQLDPANVVAIHCKAGKGRTGVAICSYLLFSR